jgi:hypothetical protein
MIHGLSIYNRLVVINSIQILENVELKTCGKGSRLIIFIKYVDPTNKSHKSFICVYSSHKSATLELNLA